MLTITASFPRHVFLNSCNNQRNVQGFRLTGLLWWQKLTWLFTHFLQDYFVDFAAQFCFCCKFSFHEKRRSSLFYLRFNSFLLETQVKFDSGMIFEDQSQFIAMYIATNEIATFCIDNRLHQMALFLFTKVGKQRLSSSYVERFRDKKIFLCCSLFFYYVATMNLGKQFRRRFNAKISFTTTVTRLLHSN